MVKRLLAIAGDDIEHFFLSVDEGTLIIGTNPWSAEAVVRGLQIKSIRCEIEVEEEAVDVDNAAAATPGGPPRLERLHLGENLHIGHTDMRLVEEDEGRGEAEVEDFSFAEPMPPEDLEEEADWSAGAPTPAAAPLQPPAHAGATGLAMGGHGAPQHPSIAPLMPAASTASPPVAAYVPPLNQGPGPRKLVVIDGADVGHSYRLPDSGTATIGKSQKHSDIDLHDLYVSRVHCELQVHEGRVTVKHLEGASGTLINGKVITQEQELRLGDVLRVGNSHLRLEAAAVDEPMRATAPKPGEEEAVEVAEIEVLEVVDPRLDELLKLEGQVLGHYQLGAVLGRGQRGVVFKGSDLKSKHVVAVKVLSPEFPKNEAEMQHFVKTLKVLPTLKHPSLLSLMGAGKTGPYCWLAREYVDGETLAALIERLGKENKLGWKRALRVAMQMGRALDFLHKHDVFHGNLTAGNVMVCTDTKTTKIAGLMLDKALEASKLQEAIKDTKQQAELAYQAPEQLDPLAAQDHRVDIYAVGTLVYALLAGHPPFLKQDQETKLIKPSRFQPDIAPAFQGAILRMLARKPEDRYQTPADLLVDLEPIAKHHEVKV